MSDFFLISSFLSFLLIFPREDKQPRSRIIERPFADNRANIAGDMPAAKFEHRNSGHKTAPRSTRNTRLARLPNALTLLIKYGGTLKLNDRARRKMRSISCANAIRRMSSPPPPSSPCDIKQNPRKKTHHLHPAKCRLQPKKLLNKSQNTQVDDGPCESWF